MGFFDGLESLWNSVTGQTAAEAAAAERAAQAQKIAQMQQAAQVYAGYRPQQQQARMNALSNISTAYQPANNALATMYGGGPSNSAYQARPAGYQPITAGGGPGQQSYRPVPQVQPGQIQASDPRNPPGSTIPLQRPTAQQQATAVASARPQTAPLPVQAAPSPAALSSAKAPVSNLSIARPSQGQMATALAAAQKPSSGSTRTLSGSLPSGSAVQGALSGAKAPVNSVRPGGAPQGLPRSETPIVGGLPGYSDPTGAIGSTGSGNNPALGLAPGPALTGSNPNMVAGPAPGAGQPALSPGGGVGPSGVSFQPGQMLMNPFNTGAQASWNLLSSPTAVPPGSPLAPTGSTRPALLPVPPAEEVKKALVSGKAENPTGKYTTPMQSKEQLMSKLSTILGKR